MLLRTLRVLSGCLLFSILPSTFYGQTYLSPTILTQASTCVTKAGKLYGMTVNGSPLVCGSGATSSNEYGQWFKFTATTTNPVVTVSNLGSSISGLTVYVNVFSGSTGSFASVSGGCQTVSGSSTSIYTSNLSAGNDYYIFVYLIGAPPSGGNDKNNCGFNICVQDRANDEWSGAVTITPNASCTTVSDNVFGATSSSAITACGGTATYDLWYSFTASSSNEIITLSNVGTSFSSPQLELYSGSWPSLTSLGCGSTTINASGLTIGTTYYIRAFSTGTAPTSPTNAGFNICVTDGPPANDNCANAILLTSGTICNKTTGTVAQATSAGTSSCSGAVKYDVWYKFVAQSATPTITLSSLGTNFTSAGLELFSSCDLTTSLGCSGTGVLSLKASNLTLGNTYYVRVLSTTTGSVPATSANFSICITDLPNVSPSGEVFKQTVLSGSNNLNDPWEVTYGADSALWVTESKGYKVYRFNPYTGDKVTILDISNGATGGGLADSEHTKFNCAFTAASVPSTVGWPQGGLAGLALTPRIDTATNKYVYLSYIYSYDSAHVTDSSGLFFTNRVVRFTYDPINQLLKSPVMICDTLPGSQDHNSQRLLVAPVTTGTVTKYYLFYAAGDMGAGQFKNKYRPNHAQDLGAYQGKILRFNLVPDPSEGTYDQWIPNDNPFTIGGKASAIWALGMRNNQGFAYAKINGKDHIYGSSHGPYSDDEINIIERAANYGHPLVIGYKSDENYKNYSAGFFKSSCPIIGSEKYNADTVIGSSYRDPIFSGYAASSATIASIWSTTANGGWPSEAWSGMDVYTNSVIPGWKYSLIQASLKKGRVLRFKLKNDGDSIALTNGKDTIPYFGSQNRYRDIALDPNGRDLYVIMDKSTTTSGPSSNNPSVVSCLGCLIKFRFLGYSNDASTNKSNIPSYLPISTDTTVNTCLPLSSDTISTANQNNNLWVPFTGPDGNIVAEVNARGNDLGYIKASFYLNSGTKREDASNTVYADRSFTITPQNQPTSPVSVRLYLTTTEFNAMINAKNSKAVSNSVTQITDLKIFKNSDSCTGQFQTSGYSVTPTYAESFGSGGYVLQADISSFSSFYFYGQSAITLPIKLLNFNGEMINNIGSLHWEVSAESNTGHFEVERSRDGYAFKLIGTVQTKDGSANYLFEDHDACNPQYGEAYYRLKLVDDKGNYSYSKVIRLQCAPSKLMVDIFPNPVHQTMNIRLNLQKADNVTIQVTDMWGRTIYSTTKFVAAGSNLIELDTQRWAAQTYSVKVVGTTANITVTKNVIKQ